MRRFLLIAVMAGASAVVLNRPLYAEASCAAPPALATAATAFVGTVTDLANGGRVATVHVDDVWRGRDVPMTVQVVGSPDLGAAATSVDRVYQTGLQYLFVPTAGGPDMFEDNSCTLTQPYSQSLIALRPRDAPGAPAPTPGSGGRLLPIALLVGSLPAIGGAILALRRRRRSIVNPVRR